MAVIKTGVVARPGTHGDEVVTADSLKRATWYQNRIPLIVGPHPAGGYAYPDDYVGTVGLRWNDEQQQVDGEFWFFDEKWDSLPEEIKRKLKSNEEIRLSAGYETRTDEQNRQKWRKWDHIALGVLNPLIDNVGVNVRMEEQMPEGFRCEEEPVITGEEEKTEKPKTLNLTPAQLQTVIDTAVEKALAKKEETPTEEEPSEEVTEKAPEEAEVALPEPEPEMVLPASAPSRKKMSGIEITEDGWWKF